MGLRKCVGRSVAWVTSKYASKCESPGQELPEGIRLYGMGGLRGQPLSDHRWRRLPSWLRAELPQGVLPIGRQDGLWVLPDGRSLQSPWVVLCFWSSELQKYMLSFTRRSELVEQFSKKFSGDPIWIEKQWPKGFRKERGVSELEANQARENGALVRAWGAYMGPWNEASEVRCYRDE